MLTVQGVVTFVLGYTVLVDAKVGYRLRILGGSKAIIENNPWQVSIQHESLHKCGGSIISPNIVLTAAHCFNNSMPLSAYTVVAGTTFLSHSGPSIQIKSIIRHEHFCSIKALHEASKIVGVFDIALIELERKLIYSEKIQPISLPSESFSIDAGTTLKISGWGLSDENPTGASDVLKEAEVEYVDWQTCKDKLSSRGLITDKSICAGVSSGLIDSCKGDSGGPLSLNGVLIGIVSWGIDCGVRDIPSVYTNVAFFRSWIKENAGI